MASSSRDSKRFSRPHSKVYSESATGRPEPTSGRSESACGRPELTFGRSDVPVQKVSCHRPHQSQHHASSGSDSDSGIPPPRRDAEQLIRKSVPTSGRSELACGRPESTSGRSERNIAWRYSRLMAVAAVIFTVGSVAAITVINTARTAAIEYVQHTACASRILYLVDDLTAYTCANSTLYFAKMVNLNDRERVCASMSTQLVCKIGPTASNIPQSECMDSACMCTESTLLWLPIRDFKIAYHTWLSANRITKVSVVIAHPRNLSTVTRKTDWFPTSCHLFFRERD